MDPNWPKNPLDSIICILCKSALPFVNRSSENFFRHLMWDHTAYYNHNLLLEISLIQPQAVQEETPQHPLIKLEPHSPDFPPHFSPEIEQQSKMIKKERLSNGMVLDPVSLQLINHNEGGGIKFSQDNNCGVKDDIYMMRQVKPAKKLKARKQDNIKSGKVKDLDLGFINQINKSEKTPNIWLPAADTSSFVPWKPTDFSRIDPISVFNEEKKPGRSSPRKQECDGSRMPANPNQHLVPEELQKLIISSNPKRAIKFTYSQRLNTQLVIDDFIMVKKKGPYLSKGGRTVCWKCSHQLCTYSVITWEGAIKDLEQHNHPPQPELYHMKQARFKLRKNLAEGQHSLVTNVVSRIMVETVPEQRDMLGSVNALKQAARRYSRKIKGVVPEL